MTRDVCRVRGRGDRSGCCSEDGTVRLLRQPGTIAQVPRSNLSQLSLRFREAPGTQATEAAAPSAPAPDLGGGGGGGGDGEEGGGGIGIDPIIDDPDPEDPK